MYAFALHDAEQDEVLLARDPLGMKPLYCHEGSSGVRFASEIKALLALLPQQPDLNPTALVAVSGGAASARPQYAFLRC